MWSQDTQSPQSAKRIMDYAMSSKAPKQLLNKHWGEIVFLIPAELKCDFTVSPNRILGD